MCQVLVTSWQDKYLDNANDDEVDKADGKVYDTADDDGKTYDGVVTEAEDGKVLTRSGWPASCRGIPV